MGKITNPDKLGKHTLLLLTALSGLVAAGGCTRGFFRSQADKEVAGVLAEKDQYPDWQIEQYHVYPDPRARFADPTCPDRPPMPADDPAASVLSPQPQNPGKAGVANIEGSGYLEVLAGWDAQNRAEAKDKEPGAKPEAEAADNPDEPRAPGYAASGTAASTTSLSSKPKPGEPLPFLLKLEQAVELGLINSREYQDAREDLFLTALTVTRQRFAFTPQLFAAGQAVREWTGARTPEGPNNNWRLNSNVGVAELFSTGALLLMDFANQTVFNLAGTGRNLTSESAINLDLVQPLLRGGGLAVTLEPLTLAERHLLYQIRAFARFRKTFYVAIAGGGGGSITGSSFQPSNVIAADPFSARAGFGTTGMVPGLIPPVPLVGNPGLQTTPGSSGSITLQTALAAPVSGYLATLLEAAQMRVDEYNIEKLEGYLKLAKAMQEGGDISQLQTDQFEQQLLTRRSSLLTDTLQYLQSLDQFKLQLGLPTDLKIELDDTAFRPLNQQFQRYEDLFREFEAASNAPARFGTMAAVAMVRPELRRIFTTAPVVRGTRFAREVVAAWTVWEKLQPDALRQRLNALREERRRLLDRQTDLETQGQALSQDERRRLERIAFELDLAELETVLREYAGQPWKKLPEAEQRRLQQARFRYVVNSFILVLAEARNERVATLREAWPDLARLCVDGVDLLKADLGDAEAAAVRTALDSRLDLMNVRAQVVDAWRQLAVFANSLLGVFNVQYHMDSFTPPGLAEPLAFSGSRSRQDLILNTELPLVRKEERNAYRACLINYQRARRILQRAEDAVKYDVRNEIRLLRQQEENYRIQQRQVELAFMTVENSLDTFQAPPSPGVASDTATRAAALTNQLINAQNSLYQSQFTMTSIWITYMNTRLQLYRDMELMPLDFRGVWLDPVEACYCPPAAPADKPLERLPEPKPLGPDGSVNVGGPSSP